MASGRPARLLQVGHIAKPHGIRGEVVVDLLTDRVERVAPGTALWPERGDEPFVVVASRPHQHRWIVQLAGVTDRSAAEAVAGTPLLAEPLDDPDALWVHEVIGTRVVETDGTDRGMVVAVLANPAHDQLELDSGALVPVVFVVGTSDGVTTIDPPAGLFADHEPS